MYKTSNLRPALFILSMSERRGGEIKEVNRKMKEVICTSECLCFFRSLLFCLLPFPSQVTHVLGALFLQIPLSQVAPPPPQRLDALGMANFLEVIHRCSRFNLNSLFFCRFYNQNQTGGLSLEAAIIDIKQKGSLV